MNHVRQQYSLEFKRAVVAQVERGGKTMAGVGVGWAMNARQAADLVVRTLCMALEQRLRQRGGNELSTKAGQPFFASKPSNPWK